MGTLNQILIPPPFLTLMSGATGFCIASSESCSVLYHTPCFISARYRTTIYQLEPNFAAKAHSQQRNSQAKEVRLRQAFLGLEGFSSNNTASPSWHMTTFVFAHLLPCTCARNQDTPCPQKKSFTQARYHNLHDLLCATMNLRRKCNPCRITHFFLRQRVCVYTFWSLLRARGIQG